jgi:hypothetical protein
VSFVTAVL